MCFEIPLYKALIVISGISFVAGSIFFAKAIRFQSQDLLEQKILDSKKEFDRNVIQMGSPGYIVPKNYYRGFFYTSVGFALLVIATFLSP
jgi:hypothetical protein